MTTRRGAAATTRTAAGLCLAGLLLAATGCGGGGSEASTETDGVTIRVTLATDPPPQAVLDEFTEETGITVEWTNLDWDSLQTSISAAATANTYFADATNVDWSRVGQLGTLDWFYPLGDYLDTAALEEDMPQLASFTTGDTVVGVPYTGSFMVTTVNTGLYEQAGVNPVPTTLEEYTEGLRQLQAAGVVEHPLSIPFAAAEGLSTYWYQTTGAFGGTVLDEDGAPQFSEPGSPGYQAAEWMVDALQSGLVPPGNINVTDSESQQTLMAQGQVASIFSDYSGIVGSLYALPDSSTVVDQVQYLPTPGADGQGLNLSNPDGIGIPRQAQYPDAAAEFIEWFTDPENQADFAGVNGPERALPSYALPSRLSAVEELAAAGDLIGGEQLSTLLEGSRPVFEGGAPAYYPEFSNAVYTNLHAAAAGEQTVDEAIAAISEVAEQLASGS